MIADMTTQCPCCEQTCVDPGSLRFAASFDPQLEWPALGEPRCLCCWINEVPLDKNHQYYVNLADMIEEAERDFNAE